jgi:hypothetical protein
MNAKMRYLTLVLSTLFLLLCYYSGKKLKRKLKPTPSAGEAVSFLSVRDLHQLRTAATAGSQQPVGILRHSSCRMETCFNFSRCVEDRFRVYIYPFEAGVYI